MSSSGYSTPLLQDILDWLLAASGDDVSATQAESEEALTETIRFMGYGEPFDREQRRLNTLLVENFANKIACLTAWAYYKDYKIANALSRSPRRAES